MQTSDKSKGLVFDLFGTWTQHFSADSGTFVRIAVHKPSSSNHLASTAELVQRGLAVIMPFLDNLPPFTPSGVYYLTVLDGIDKMITGGTPSWL